ncbi:FAD binding domain-containing protein [uncultured Martelella sp.]|uniref:FAD binding domain-containing protein n=1 Tax=uncultured Martelella sp. TaxID=392331 RepID=UPI0029C6B8FE|nr:FAD binding domain-containing protein [uncultured Martelella sp.]
MLDNVLVPSDLKAAFDALASSRSSALLSGGTLLMPEINTKAGVLDTLVSLRKLSLSGITVEGCRATIGATTTLDAFGRDPRLAVLSNVIESIASPPIRNVATVGGNLFTANGGDLAVSLMALDAEAEVASENGTRRTSVAEIVSKGVGHEEIATRVTFDIPDRNSWFFTKAMRRASNSGAIVTIAAHLTIEDGLVSTVRLVLGGVAPRPVRALTVEKALIGKPLDAEHVTAAAAAFEEDTELYSDAIASAWYRARVIPVHIRRALTGA